MKVYLIAMMSMLLLLGAGPYNADQGRYKGPARDTASGAAADGFALALTSDATSVQLGQPVWVTLEIRNVTKSLQYASTRARGDGSYVFTIVNETTRHSASLNTNSAFGQDVIGGPLLGRPVPANSSFYLRFDLSQLYNIYDRGAYLIRLDATQLKINGRWIVMPPSNAIRITVR